MKKLLLLAILLSMILSGCAQANALPETPAPTSPSTAQAPAILSSPAPTQPPASIELAETPLPTPAASSDSGGLCRNPYYPVVDGASWVYEMQDLPQVVHTMSIEEEGSFKIAMVDANSAAVLEGRCTEQGIVLMDMGMGGNFFSEDGSSSVDSQYSEGVTLPNDLRVGSEWSQVSGIQAQSDDGETTLDARIITNYVVTGEETITVPAGTFTALRIEQNGSLTLQGQELLTQGILWYARGVGNIKSESGMAGGERFVSVLVSYNIP